MCPEFVDALNLSCPQDLVEVDQQALGSDIANHASRRMQTRLEDEPQGEALLGERRVASLDESLSGKRCR